MASLVPLAVGDATDTLFGSIALATAGGTIFGTIGAMWVLPLMLMPRIALGEVTSRLLAPLPLKLVSTTPGISFM